MNKDYDAILSNVSLEGTKSGSQIAWGHISNDSKGRFDNGEWIHTSRILNLEGNILQTMNTRYKIKDFSGEIGEWIKEHGIDLETKEGQLAVRLRWF